MGEPAFANIYLAVVLLLSPIYSYILYFVIAIFGMQDLYLMQFFSHIFVMFLPFVVYMVMTKQKLSQVLHLKKPGWKNCLYVTAICLLVQPVLMACSAISSLFFPNNVGEFVFGTVFQYPLWASFIVIAVTPAIFEEITLRGVVYHHYEGLPVWKAALVNGLFFAFIHGNLQQFLYAFLIGILFAYFVYYSGSIFTSMLGHFVINGTQLLYSYIILNAYDNAAVEEMEMALSTEGYGILPYIMAVGLYIIISLLFMPVIVIVMRMFIRNNPKKDIPMAGSVHRGQQETVILPEEGMMVPVDDLEDKIDMPAKRSRVLTPTFIIVIIIYLFLLLFM